MEADGEGWHKHKPTTVPKVDKRCRREPWSVKVIVAGDQNVGQRGLPPKEVGEGGRR
ncbi:hypothetical protein RP20_CCG026480 [Aedes albopictus]|nr:hypothetical protein RP20_CCG026480 [Aedes albopictus]